MPTLSFLSLNGELRNEISKLQLIDLQIFRDKRYLNLRLQHFFVAGEVCRQWRGWKDQCNQLNFDMVLNVATWMFNWNGLQVIIFRWNRSSPLACKVKSIGQNRKVSKHSKYLTSDQRCDAYNVDTWWSLPGTLEDKHKIATAFPALRRQDLISRLLGLGRHDVKLGADHLQLGPNDLVIGSGKFLLTMTSHRELQGYCIHFRSGFSVGAQQIAFEEFHTHTGLIARHIVIWMI